MRPRRPFSWKIILPVVLVEVLIALVVWKSCVQKTQKERESSPPNADLGNIRTPEDKPETKPDPLWEKTAPWDYSRVTRRLPKNVDRFGKFHSGIIVDLSTRRVLWEKDSAKQVPVASLTKMMTALLIMERLSDQNSPEPLSWESIVVVTDVVSGIPPSRLGLKKNERYSVGDLMTSMLIASHNDSACQLAEVAAGSVPAFVRRMNIRAKEWGLSSACFNTPNGLPQGKNGQNALCSAADITILAEMMLRHPQLMELCSRNAKTISSGRVIYGHNNLLGKNKVKGCIGFKTGFTNKAGCCLAFGVNRNGRIIIGCVTGFNSGADRDNFCRNLIEWAYEQKR